ncbi:MAG: LamG-like jellyroll fold domain-containing protein, partial [Armatimonadota bacterium]
LPSAVLISYGRNFTRFSFTPEGVDSQTSFQIHATANGTTVDTTLTVNPARPTKLYFEPDTVMGGNNTSGVVNLDGSAGPSGLSLALNGNSSRVVVPATVQVLKNQKRVVFTTQTGPVTALTDTFPTATDGTTTVTGKLTLNRAVLIQLSSDKTNVPGGTSFVMTATLNGIAPVGGMVVNLSASDPALIIPATITVPAGQRVKKIQVDTKKVTVDKLATITGDTGVSDTQSVTVACRYTSFSSVFHFKASQDTIGFTGGTYNGACNLASNFTVEAVVRPNAATDGYIWQQYRETDMNEFLQLIGGKFNFCGTGHFTPVSNFPSDNFVVGKWTHIAWTYDGTTARVYHDGLLFNSTPIAPGFDPVYVAQAAALGKNGAVPFFNSDVSFLGDIAEFRISSSVRYTGASFTPPKDPFVNDAQTMLLVDASAFSTAPTSFMTPGTQGVTASVGVGNGQSTSPTWIPFTP